MNAERWRAIERLFQAALQQPADSREAFLSQECRGDRDLLLEVQALLRNDPSGKHFLEGPALDPAARMFSETASATAAPPILTGLRLGAYVLESPLGAGGMGVVYRAADTKLNRPVAIKFLSDSLAGPNAHRRFQREARTASSLNHPHIVTVHDAGELDGRPYLVTEFVDGGTLRDWTAGNHGWRETVELLIGVADGLAAAHEAGILHRDVKPENILITKSRYAKLSDFGLAKLYEAASPAEATRSAVVAQTQPGVIAGTVAYMSPEQASGARLDARSDIFSFGVVLYEALAGRRPFTGPSTPDVLYAIVHHPTPQLPEPIPASLQALLDRALQKDPARRFQTMHDMVTELREVARQSVAISGIDAQRGSGFRRWPATVAIGLAIAAAVFWVVWWQGETVPSQSAPLQYVQLTNYADSAVSPALSPDGRMLAFIRGESALGGSVGQVYVKLLPNGEPVPLTHDERIKANPKFSPDGASITYTTALGAAATTLDTWVVPVLGGQARPFLSNASGLTWIPNRTGSAAVPFVLFSEFTGRGVQMSIATATTSRTEHRTVYMPSETGMAHRSYLSPDRAQVLLVEMESGAWLPCRVAPFDGSATGRPVGPAPAQCTDAAWSPDGRWMYFSTNTGGGAHVWRQRFPDGTPEQVTFGVTEEEGIEFDPDGRSFVTSIGNRQSTIWIHDSSGDRQITSEGFAFFPNISPDGSKVYYLVRGTEARNVLTGGFWVADLRSGTRQRLFPDFQVAHYNVSADGQRVVFVALDPDGRAPVWVASLNGATPPRRVTSMNSQAAYFGGAGDVVFASHETSKALIYRIKEDGSGLQVVSSIPSLLPFGVSPGGQWIPAAEGPSPDTRNVLAVYPLDGGSPIPICRCYPPPNIDNGPMPPQMSWTPDGKFLYLKFGTSTYAVPLQPGQVLPAVPSSGFQSKDAVAALPGARLIAENHVFPGPNPAIYAFMKVATQRNIYRVLVQRSG